MNVDQLLNLERRTGVKNGDIEDFERKVDDVQAAIKALAAGTIKPEDVKIEGIETEEDILKKQEEQQKRLKEQREKAEKLRIQRKKEETERWWAGAEIYKPSKANEEVNTISSDQENEKKLQKVLRYTTDYSRWNEWVPDDKVSKEEKEEEERRLEEEKNKDFEKNNPDFCSQFVSDMEKRQKELEKKQGNSDISRLKGNRFYKVKKFDEALDCYMEALKSCPFDPKTLLNIAQVYLQQKNVEDGLEFLSRTLYIDPHNIKALSRKGFALGEIWKIEEACETIELAVKLDPNNSDLLKQQKELKIIEKENQQEKLINNTIPEQTKTENSKLIENYSDFDVLTNQLKTKSEVYLSDASNIISENDVLEWSRIISKLSKYYEGSEVDKLKLRVFLRTQGILGLTVRVSKTLSDKVGLMEKIAADMGKDNRIPEINILMILFDFITKTIDNQRSSKLQVLESQLIFSVKNLLKVCSISNTPLLTSMLKFLSCCCCDDTCIKTQQAIFSDKNIILQLAMILGNSATLLKDDVNTTSTLEVMQLIVSIFKIMVFEPEVGGKNISRLRENNIFKKMDDTGLACLVCSLGSTTHETQKWLEKGKSVTSEEKQTMIGLEIPLMEILLGFSQVESMRKHFTIPIPTDDKQGKSDFPINTITVVLNAIKGMNQSEEIVSNGLAVLMNALISDDSNGSIDVRILVADAGGLEIAGKSLHLNHEERLSLLREKGEIMGQIWSRRAGLLSRLCACTEKNVQNFMKNPRNYRMFCRRVKMEDVGENTGAWQSMEISHFVRILASIAQPTKELLKIGFEENVCSALLGLFPSPREDCGVITEKTVVLMPATIASPLLLGNAARCLMPYADDPTTAVTIYEDPTGELRGIEKLICAMATCTDMRIRKNIAILLAKGCRNASVKEKVTRMRGLQMIVELQDKL